MTTSCGSVRKKSTKTVMAMSAGLPAHRPHDGERQAVSTPTAMVSSATSTVSQNPPRIDGQYWARIAALKKLSRSGAASTRVERAVDFRRERHH